MRRAAFTGAATDTLADLEDTRRVQDLRTRAGGD